MWCCMMICLAVLIEFVLHNRRQSHRIHHAGLLSNSKKPQTFHKWHLLGPITSDPTASFNRIFGVRLLLYRVDCVICDNTFRHFGLKNSHAKDENTIGHIMCICVASKNNKLDGCIVWNAHSTQLKALGYLCDCPCGRPKISSGESNLT